MEPRGHGATKHTESRSHRDMATRLRRGPAPGSPATSSLPHGFHFQVCPAPLLHGPSMACPLHHFRKGGSVSLEALTHIPSGLRGACAAAFSVA